MYSKKIVSWEEEGKDRDHVCIRVVCILFLNTLFPEIYIVGRRDEGARERMIDLACTRVIFLHRYVSEDLHRGRQKQRSMRKWKPIDHAWTLHRLCSVPFVCKRDLLFVVISTTGLRRSSVSF